MSCCALLKYTWWHSDGGNQTYLCLSLCMAAVWSVGLMWWLPCGKINPHFLLSWVSFRLPIVCCVWQVTTPGVIVLGEGNETLPPWEPGASLEKAMLMPFILGWMAMQGAGIFITENLESPFWWFDNWYLNNCSIFYIPQQARVYALPVALCCVLWSVRQQDCEWLWFKWLNLLQIKCLPFMFDFSLTENLQSQVHSPILICKLAAFSFNA